MKAGQEFRDFEEFVEELNTFSKETQTVFVILKSKTVQCANKSVSGSQPRYEDQFKYAYIKYGCKHYGKAKPRGKGIRSNQRTVKLECPAHISASVDRKKGKLIILDVDVNHNHEQSVELFKLYPENRKMNEDEKHTAIKLLELNVEARRIVSVIREFSGKELTSRDIFNLKTRIRHDGKDEVNALIDLMEQVGIDNGKVQFGIDENDELRILYFQTEEMWKDMLSFPEVIFLDGTYRVNDKRMALYSILVEDGNGNGSVVAYGLLSDERKETMVWFLDFFVKFNPSALKGTQVVMIDKDFSELAAVRKLLPDANVFLCLFHVMKAFRTKVATLHLSEEEKNKIRKILQLIAYSSTPKEYDQHYDRLKDVCDTSFIEYFDTNWHSMKEMWVSYYRNQKFTLGNDTNNRIESHHQKVKKALGSQKKSLAECVGELLDLQKTRQRDKTYKDALDKVCIRYRHNDTTAETAQIYAIATTYAANLILKEVETAKRTNYNIVASGEENKYSLSSNSRSYITVRGDDKIHCTCSFYTTVGLPCRHAFAIGLKNSQILFCESWVSPRWRKVQQRPHSQAKETKPVTEEHNVIQKIRPSDKKLTRTDKFKQLRVILNGIADISSELGHREFQARFDQLTQLYDVWRNNSQCMIVPLPAADAIPNVKHSTAIQQENEQLEQQLCCSVDSSGPADGMTPVKSHTYKPTVSHENDESRHEESLATVKTTLNTKDCGTDTCDRPTCMESDTTPLGECLKLDGSTLCNEPSPPTPANALKSLLCRSTSKLRLKLTLPKSPLPKGRPKGAETNCIGLPTKRKRIENRKKLSTKYRKISDDCQDEDRCTSVVLNQFLVYIQKQVLSGCVNIVAEKVQLCRFPVTRNIGSFMAEASNPAHSLCKEITLLWEDFTTAALERLLLSPSLLPLSANSSLDRVSYLELLSVAFVGAYHLKCDPLQFCQTLQDKPIPLRPAVLVKRQTVHSRILDKKRMKIGNCTFNREDCASLEGNNWLTDQAIHAYLALHQREINQNCGRKCLVLPCHIYDKWEQKEYGIWQFPKKRFLEYSTIMIPANTGHHWVLIIANPGNGTVGVFNSIRSSKVENKILKHWRQYLFLRNQTLEEELPEPVMIQFSTLGQSDGCSCGIFVLMAAEAYLAGEPTCVMRQCHVPMYREYVMCRVLESCARNDEICCDWPVCLEPTITKKKEDGEVWVECDCCGIWVHLCCVHLEYPPPEHEEYICPKCEQSQQKRLLIL